MQVFELTNQRQSKDIYVGPVTAYAGTKVVQIQLKAGSEIPEHRTNADVLIIVQKGHVVFGFADGEAELAPDRLLHILPDEPHSLRAVEDTELLLVRTER